MYTTIKSYFCCFLFYAFLGWIYEVLLGIFVYKTGFINRGFLFGPYLPIYGFGSLMLLFFLEKYVQGRIEVFGINIMPILLFFIIVVLTTAVELICSYIMEAMIGGWLWDYSNEHIHFEGRIGLIASIRFGIGGMAILYLIHPLYKKIEEHINGHIFDKLVIFLLLVFLLDLSIRPFCGSNFKGIKGVEKEAVSSKQDLS